jgi:hypothetical protein
LGSIYAALERLEAKGLVESSPGDPYARARWKGQAVLHDNEGRASPGARDKAGLNQDVEGYTRIQVSSETGAHMTFAGPPRLATWILLHLMPGERNEALAGDLHESFRAGRSSIWYWRQVLNAVVIRWLGSLFNHWPALFFAAAWATLSPTWIFLIHKLYRTNSLIGYAWRLPWPWSTVCYLGLSAAESLLFIWAGLLIYLLVHLILFGTAKHWRLRRAIVASLAGFVLGSACDVVILLMLIDRPMYRGVGIEISTALISLPHLIATFCTFLGSRSKG